MRRNYESEEKLGNWGEMRWTNINEDVTICCQDISGGGGGLIKLISDIRI